MSDIALKDIHRSMEWFPHSPIDDANVIEFVGYVLLYVGCYVVYVNLLITYDRYRVFWRVFLEPEYRTSEYRMRMKRYRDLRRYK